jgi:hypothetical protein
VSVYSIFVFVLFFFSNIETYFLPIGAQQQTTTSNDNEFVLTDTVRRNLRMCARILSHGFVSPFSTFQYHFLDHTQYYWKVRHPLVRHR